MSYRDDLDAAYAQISMLQGQLADLRSQLSGSPTQQTDELHRQLQNQREEIKSLRLLLQTRRDEENASLQRLLATRSEELEKEKTRNQQQKHLLQAQTTEIESLRKLLRAKQGAQPEPHPTPPPLPSKKLKSVVEHNLSLPAASPGKGPSGLSCPRCQALGETIEMNLGNTEESNGRDYSARELICPRCLLHDWRRNPT